MNSSEDKARQELIEAARAVVYADRGDQIIPSGLIDALSKAADKASASSSCAAQEPIPEHYSLDEVAARTLRDWLNDGDGGLNDVTIHVGRGHGGPGLYVSLTEYPEEGAALLVEAPQNESRSAAAKPSAGTGS